MPLRTMAPPMDAADAVQAPLGLGGDLQLDADDRLVLDGVPLAALGVVQVHR